MVRIRCSGVEEEVQLEVFCDCSDQARVSQLQETRKLRKEANLRSETSIEID